MTALPDVAPPAGARTYEHPLDLVGGTPLVRVAHPNPAVRLFVKLDQYNLGGSSKDRIGLAIVNAAIASGELAPGDRIIDFGAGNTAVGYALAGIATGHPVTLVANPALSPEKANLLRFLGVDIIPGRADVPRDDPESWALVAQRHADEDPATWWARQESTPANPGAHEASTGPEIWQQTGGAVTHFLAAVATGGTVTGTGRYLKSRRPDVRVVATDFVEGPNGAGNLLPVFRGDPGSDELVHDWPPNLDLAVLDQIELRPRAQVIEAGWHLARTQGLVLGLSSVLSLVVATEIADAATEETVIVSFSADSGRDYLTREYDAGWLQANGFAQIADRFDPAGSAR